MGLTAAPEVAAFALDGVTPRRHVAARSVEDVVAAILEANASREAVVLWSGGTRITVGDPPERYDTALDLRGLRGVIAHEPADLTVTVLAGTTMSELAATLAPHGQRWPVEVADPDRATVGGTIASAAGGPSRHRYFHVRDRTIGCRAVLGDGTLTRAGGRVVKNVTGYDLTRLYSGSYGTLAALVEVTLKLEPVPERTLTLRADLPDPSMGYRATRELMRARLPLDSVAMLMGDVGADLCPTWTSLYVRLAGTEESVERLRGAVRKHAPLVEAPGDVWTRIASLPSASLVSLRASWPPGEPIEIYPERAVWYPGVDLMYILDREVAADHLRGVRAGLEARAGALVVERAPPELRRAVGTWGAPRLPLEIARRLRSAFDPNGVLAPGRVP
ncbi:MAG: FAD-binding oxidoreductase [Candidatus Limnocylindria bacterium]